MRSPAKMEIIQIEITNACPHLCANCTRFCGHHKKPFFMETDFFKKAVDSLDGFGGTVGIMGGEPTLHPRFEELMDHYRQKRCPKSFDVGRKPITDFAKHVSQNLLGGEKLGLPGLWTSLGNGYYRHFETIQEIFHFQAINDHMNPGLHQALLITRKELGIPDDKWFELRDKCWIQNLWSASITPKGAFFCEVAAALDMLLDGPGGWPLEPGWWKREPKDFGEQLNWCEFCSAALKVPRTVANSKKDTVSPVIFDKLVKAGSPKALKGMVTVMDVSKYNELDYEVNPSNVWFLPGADDRFRITGTYDSIKPRQLSAVLLDVQEDASIELIKETLSHFESAVIVSSNPRLQAELPKGTVLAPEGRQMSDAANVNKAMEALNPKDWVFILSASTKLHPDFRATIRGTVFNPGCIYHCGPKPPGDIEGRKIFPDGDDALAGHIYFFNMMARSLKGRASGKMLLEGNGPEEQILPLWPEDKRIEIEVGSAERGESISGMVDAFSTKTTEAHVLGIFSTLSSLGTKVALFGAGKHTVWLLNLLKRNGQPLPVVIFDDTPKTSSILDVPVVKPEKRDSFDYEAVLLSTDKFFDSMKERCAQIWKGAKPVINLYSNFTLRAGK